MFGLNGVIVTHFLITPLVYAGLGDVEVFVTDKADERIGQIHAINMTSRLVTTLSGYKILRPVAIDYDDRDERIYWSDVMSNEIRTSRFNGNDERPFLDLNSFAVADGFAIDRQNRLLFYTDTGNDVIKSVSLSTPQNSTTIVESELEKPRGVTLFPEKRLLFWTDWSGWASIQRCNYDGTGRQSLVTSDIQWPNGITLDKTNNAIYWCDAGTHRIEFVKIDGSGRTRIMSEPNTHYFSIYFFEDTLFITDWNIAAVRQISLNGTEISRVHASRFTKLTGLVVLRAPALASGDKSKLTSVLQQQTDSTTRPSSTTDSTTNPSSTTDASGIDLDKLKEPRASASYTGDVKEAKSSEFAVLITTIIILLIGLCISTVYVFKYRRDYLRLKTYDHLSFRRSKSVTTTVSRLSHDYTNMSENESPMTSAQSKVVCPDILIRESRHTDQCGEWESSEENDPVFKEEERQYMSVSSLLS